MDFFELVLAQQDAAARREQQRINSGRLAFSQHKIGSTGLGAKRRDEAVVFDVVFLEEPLFVSGSSLVTRPTDLPDPVCSAGVWQWQRNEKGHYTGAFVNFSVSTGEVLFDAYGAAVEVIHHLLFQGIAFKDLGQRVSTEAQMVTPRTVGFGV